MSAPEVTFANIENTPVRHIPYYIACTHSTTEKDAFCIVDTITNKRQYFASYSDLIMRYKYLVNEYRIAQRIAAKKPRPSVVKD